MLVPLSLPPGLNSDDTTFGAEGRWADSNNCRFDNGRPQSVGGALSQFTLAGGGYFDLFVFSRGGTATVAYGQQSKLQVGAGIASPSDRTPAGPPTANRGWCLAAWGETLLAAVRDGKLYEQSGVGTATEVVAAPDRITSMVVTPERQVLALGCNEEVSTTFNNLCIRGCDIENYTNWTTASTNNAFEHILDGATGGIVVGKVIGPYVAVWTEAGLHLGQFVGDPGQTYRFDLVANGCGLAAPRAIAIIDQVAYWLTTDLRIMQWTPGTQPTAIPCPVSRDFRDNLINISASSEAYLHAVAMHRRQEVWFFYFDSRDGSGNDATRYIAYSVGESALAQRPVWFRGQTQRNALIDSSLLYNPADGYSVLAVDSGGVVYIQDIDGQGTVPAGYIQSADQYLDNSQMRVMIRRVIPDFELQTNSVSLTLFMRDRPMSSPVTKGPYTIATSDTKKDFRASGKIAAAKLSWSSASNLRVRLGKPLFDVVPMGER